MNSNWNKNEFQTKFVNLNWTKKKESDERGYLFEESAWKFLCLKMFVMTDSYCFINEFKTFNRLHIGDCDSLVINPKQKRCRFDLKQKILQIVLFILKLEH